MNRMLAVFIGFMMFSVAHTEFNVQTITDQLESELLRSAPNELIRVNISMKESYNSNSIGYGTKGFNKKGKHNFITEMLKFFSA